MRYKNLKALLNGYKTDLASKRELEIRLKELDNFFEEDGLKGIAWDSLGGASGISKKTEKIAINKADGEKKLLEVQRLNKAIREINNRVLRVENLLSILDEEERKIIEFRYISFYSWENICSVTFRSYRTCKKKEKEAFEKMFKILEYAIKMQ